MNAVLIKPHFTVIAALAFLGAGAATRQLPAEGIWVDRGTRFIATGEPRPGKNVGRTDWTHGR